MGESVVRVVLGVTWNHLDSPPFKLPVDRKYGDEMALYELFDAVEGDYDVGSKDAYPLLDEDKVVQGYDCDPYLGVELMKLDEGGVIMAGRTLEVPEEAFERIARLKRWILENRGVDIGVPKVFIAYHRL